MRSLAFFVLLLSFAVFFTGRDVLGLSFPKNPSVRIRAMGQNQRIIRCDACDPSSAWDGYHQPI